jgi:hypothetical protein
MLLPRLPLLTVAAALAVAAPAGASTLDEPAAGSSTYIWTGTAADDTLTVAPADGGAITLTAGDEITVAPALTDRCSPAQSQVVTCTITSITTVDARGGDGADTIRMEAPVRLSGHGGPATTSSPAGPWATTGRRRGHRQHRRGARATTSPVSNDEIAEQVDCGEGNDTYVADPTDTRIGCERAARANGRRRSGRSSTRPSGQNMDEDEPSSDPRTTGPTCRAAAIARASSAPGTAGSPGAWTT